MDISGLEKFKQTIASGKIALGAVMTLTDPTVAELAGYAGMDFIWIDSEHNAYNNETLKNLVIAAKAGGAAPLVRVRSNDPDLIKPVLDMAPAGVIIPMVCSAEAARKAVGACKYPPVGFRGCGVRRAVGYGALDFFEYLKKSANEPLVIIQIEHVDAVRNLDEILAVPGIDSICVGPCDLSGSMGILNQMNDPELNKVLDEVCAKVKKSGHLLGTAAGDFPRWKERGVNWFTGVSDWGGIAGAFRNFRKECEKC